MHKDLLRKRKLIKETFFNRNDEIKFLNSSWLDFNFGCFFFDKKKI